MPLKIADCSAAPECDGRQWSVENENELAFLVAAVLIGRAQHAARVLQGARKRAVHISEAMRSRLRAQLFPAPGPTTWHRDGLLFEVICWIVARMTAESNDIISDPHLTSTQQGVDTIKVSFDPRSRNITRATVCEQKCTDNPRDQFRDEVLPAFRAWVSGARDNQLVQSTMSLLDRFELSDDEHVRVYDRLVQERPLAFQASLTVSTGLYDAERCAALFKDFRTITPEAQDRFGDIFPLNEMRGWFAGFAQKVWANIEAHDV